MTAKGGNKNKGFTLVEIIVVLVLLTLLAAITVPMLLGHIDESKLKADIISGQALMSAVESQLSVEWGYADPGNFSTFNTDKDIYMFKDQSKYGNFISKVFEIADVPDDPFLVIFYTRKVDKKKDDATGEVSFFNNPIEEQHCAYTCYSLVYWRSKDSTPVYYDFVNNEWKKGSPYADDLAKRKTNIIQTGALAGQELRVCVLSSTSSHRNSVTELNSMILTAVGYPKSGGMNSSSDIGSISIN